MAILSMLLVALVATCAVVCVRIARQRRPRLVRQLVHRDEVVVRFTGGRTLTLDAALASLDERTVSSPPRLAARGTVAPPARRGLPGMSSTAELAAVREHHASCRLRIPPKPIDVSDEI